LTLWPRWMLRTPVVRTSSRMEIWWKVLACKMHSYCACS
jgi:hypothetical protein